MKATQINNLMGVREWLMLITLSILWGGSFFFVEVALNDLPTFTIVAIRVLIAAIVLWSVVFVTKLPIPKDAVIWLAFFVMALLNNAIPFSLITWGQTQISSGFASILNASAPFFTVIVAGLLLPDEKVKGLKITGVLVGFIGVAVMIGLPDTQDDYYILGQLAVLLGGVSYAFAATFGRRFKALGVQPIVLASSQSLFAFLIITPIALFVDGVPNPYNVSLSSVYSLLGLGILSTAIAYILYFKILASAGALNAILVTLLIPVSGVLLGVFILQETLELVHLVGMGLIAVGLSFVDGRLWKKT
jgi:drug/metabolite transporter (DMT)-like permease